MSSQDQHIFGAHREHDDSADLREQSDSRIELREEELAARKESVETGRVSVGTEIVEDQQTLEVPVTHDELIVERHPVDRRPSDEPIGAGAEDVVRVPLHKDQVSVDKQAVVYEEVSVGKRAVEETQSVSGTVRKEVVDVDSSGDVAVNDRSREQR